MLLHVMGGRYDFATQPPKGQNFFRSPVCEQENLIPDTNFRPGDVYLPCWSAVQPAALDVTLLTVNANSSAYCQQKFALTGLSIAFSRLAQSVSVTLGGNAIMLIARSAEL